MDLVNLALRDFKSFPKLTVAEGKNLKCKYNQAYKCLQSTADIRELLIKSVIPWCVKCAVSRTKNLRMLPLEDVIQAGFIAAMDAVDKFDPDKGGLTTYAVWHVHKRIRLLVAGRYIVHVPIYLQDRLDYNTEANGKEYAHLEKARTATFSTDPVEMHMSDLASPTCDEEQKEENLVHLDQLDRLRSVMLQLSEREQYILQERANGRTLDQISQELNITRERVRQLVNKAIAEVKYKLGITTEEEYLDHKSKHKNKMSKYRATLKAKQLAGVK